MLRRHLQKLFAPQQQNQPNLDPEKRARIASAALQRQEKAFGFGTKKIAIKPKNETETEMVEKVSKSSV